MDDELRCLELSVKSLCCLMNPENLRSQTKKIPEKHIPCGYLVHCRRNTQKRLHISIVHELKLHENNTNAANYTGKEKKVDFSTPCPKRKLKRFSQTIYHIKS